LQRDRYGGLVAAAARRRKGETGGDEATVAINHGRRCKGMRPPSGMAIAVRRADAAEDSTHALRRWDVDDANVMEPSPLAHVPLVGT